MLPTRKPIATATKLSRIIFERRLSKACAVIRLTIPPELFENSTMKKGDVVRVIIEDISYHREPMKG